MMQMQCVARRVVWNAGSVRRLALLWCKECGARGELVTSVVEEPVDDTDVRCCFQSAVVKERDGTSRVKSSGRFSGAWNCDMW